MCFQLLAGASPVAVTWPDKALLKYRQCGFKAVRKRRGMLFRKFFRHGQGLGCSSAVGKSDRGSSWAQARPRAALKAELHLPQAPAPSGRSSIAKAEVRAALLRPVCPPFVPLQRGFLLSHCCLEQEKKESRSCGMFAKGWERSGAGWWFLAKFVSIVKACRQSNACAASLAEGMLHPNNPQLWHFGV